MKMYGLILSLLIWTVTFENSYAQLDLVDSRDDAYHFHRLQYVRGASDQTAFVKPISKSDLFLSPLAGRYLEDLDWQLTSVDQGDSHRRRNRLYSFSDDDNFVSVFSNIGFSNRWVGNNSLSEDYWGFAGNSVTDLGIVWNYSDWISLQTQVTADFFLLGKKDVFNSDPEIGIGGFAQFANSTFWFVPSKTTTGSLRLKRGPFGLNLGREFLDIGQSSIENVIMSRSSRPLPFLGLGAKTKRFSYTFLYTDLSDPIQRIQIDDDAHGFTFKNERHLVVHRFDAKVNSNIQVGYTELIVWGLRGLDLNYLNPVVPLFFFESENGDRDNVMSAFDASIRPIAGIELYSTLLLDDLHITKPFSNSLTNKWAFQFGVNVAPFNSGLLTLEYTRIEPFVYVHRFSFEGENFNSYHDNNSPLGHSLGPNSDQVAFAVKHWFGDRVMINFLTSFIRKGLNYIDENGDLVNVGGDLLNGNLGGTAADYGGFENIFLAGKRVNTKRLQLGANYRFNSLLSADLRLLLNSPDEGSGNYFVGSGFMMKL